jgi:hypothetical protein
MLVAATGLLDNTALQVNTDLTSNIAAYENLPAISTFAAVIANATGTVANSTLANLQQVGSTDLPAITNTVPADYAGFVAIGNVSVLANTYATGFSGAVSNRANTIMGDGDLGKFSQIYQTSVTYRDQSNQYIATGQNAGAINATFVSMDSLSTGGISDVSTDLPAFGDDLTRLGYTINLAELNLLGFPSALLRQTIARGNGGILPALKLQLEINGVTTTDLLTLTTAPTPDIVGSQELAIYRAMLNIRGEDLAQILDILDVTVLGLSSMADLLDPVKIFPNSYLSLTVPPPQTADATLATPSIYIQAATVNNQLGQVFGTDGACQIRNKIMPADQALATQAIGRSLQTIQNISDLELPDFAAAVKALETFANLLIIQGATTAVSDAIISSITGEVAPTLTSGNITIPVSTGAGNTFVTYDFIGTAAGYPHANALNSAVLDITAMTTAGELTSLLEPTGAYAAMESVLAGNLTVAPPWGSGVYGNINLALDAVIANTNTEIANIAATSTYTTNLTGAWATMSQQLIREEYNQYLAHVELDELTANSLPTVMSLAGQLHDIGLDITPRDSADFFEATANAQNAGGQAVIASLREGRNIAALQAVGIGINTNLSDALPQG